MADEEAWVRFAAAVATGLSALCDRDGYPSFDGGCVTDAVQQADAMLAEFRTRFPAKDAAT